MATTVVVLGASVRALAESAARAGWNPIAYDLFGDLDLRRLARTYRVARERYPAALAHVARAHRGLPRIYTGGLENSPQLLDELAHGGPLWGNSRAVVERVRDPFGLAEFLVGLGLPMPPMTRKPEDIPQDGSWLCKPMRGSGGIGIWAWHGGRLPASSYLQRRVSGLAHSAVFVSVPGASAMLVGVSRQLVGSPFCQAGKFRYCGNIGPIELGDSVTRQLERLGGSLCRDMGVRGLFGVDFLLEEDTIWPLEVNPRYTASVELFERAWGVRSLLWHQAAFQSEPAVEASRGEPMPRSTHVVGKAILFAQRPCRVRPSAPCYQERGDARSCADLPSPLDPIEPGQPVLTIFETAPTAPDCEDRLRQTLERIERDWLI